MKQILVIEDDSAVRGMIVETLMMKGWNPVAAVNGEEGIRTAGELKPDLILCDIQMPKADGYEVLESLKQNPETAMVPFVFLTGLGDKPRMRQAMEAGADDYLVKPFTIQELIAAVEARFQKQAAIEEEAGKKLHELRETLSFALPHELVTPLNAILGFSSLLLESPEVSREQITEYAAHIHAAGQRLRGLVEKFLVYAQVELSASDPAQRQAHALLPPGRTQDAITAAALRAAHDARRANDLRIETEEAEHRISAAHLERMVRELAENAFKFSSPGSAVEVRSEIAGGFFKLEVADAGSGLTPEQIRKVGASMQFDRKLQEQQGTGLGLVIARRLAELYGGTLRIESAPGARTTVAVSIPA